jgi:DNA replication protein DnaC
VNFGVKPEDVKPLQQYNAYNKTTAALKSKAINYIKNFNNMLKSENNWFGIFGQPGSGKSHVAVAIGAAILNREVNPIKAVYMPYLEVMRQLKANTLDDEYYINLLNRYQRAQVLIIDDLFKDKVKRGKLAFDLTEADIKHIYPIINYRYVNKMPTIISSECTPDMLLDLDRALCGRLLDRCDENITVFVGEEFDYRMRRFERKDTGKSC